MQSRIITVADIHVFGSLNKQWYYSSYHLVRQLPLGARVKIILIKNFAANQWFLNETNKFWYKIKGEELQTGVFKSNNIWRN